MPEPTASQGIKQKLDIPNDLCLIVVLHREDASKSMTINVAKLSKEVPADLPKHIYTHPDLFSILSRLIMHWGMSKPVLTAPDGKTITNIDKVKKYRVVFARELTPAEEPDFKLDTPCGPTPYPIVGNIPHVLPQYSLELAKLAKAYGAVVPLELLGEKAYSVADAEILRAADINPDVKKLTNSVFKEIRRLGGDGLLTASDDEESWGIAHRVLVPGFGPKSLAKMAPGMFGPGYKLIDRLGKFKPNDDIEILLWTTRVTFDIIAACGFGYDLNTLDIDEEHPFCTKLTYCLTEVEANVKRTGIEKFLAKERLAKMERQVNELREFARDKILEPRKKSGKSERGDFLDLMLFSTDPKTGKKMTDENIVHNILTLLVAGHETTSSLMSWTLYLLATNPEILQRVRHEVDSVCHEAFSTGRGLTDVELGKLSYTLMTLKEALRIYPSIGDFAKDMSKDTRVCGFAMEKDAMLDVAIYGVHRNPIYWGENADEFNPDNFSEENETKRHPYAYCPFGMGPRACIGREFAMLEARVVVPMLIYHFDFAVSPNASPRAIQTITMRPEYLFLRFAKRKLPGSMANIPLPQMASTPKFETQATPASANTKKGIDLTKAEGSTLPPLAILFGSNMGTCRDIATDLGVLVREKVGFHVDIKELDSVSQDELKSTPLALIITSTYNGTPPDNAKSFEALIKGSKLDLGKMRYAVFGVGNTQWRGTFQAFPVRVDERLKESKARCLAERGVGNVDQGGDMEKTLDQWKTRVIDALKTVYADQLAKHVPNAAEKDDVAPLTVIPVDASKTEATPIKIPLLRPDAAVVKVLEHRNLQSENSERKTIHLELELLAGQSYETGDHYGIYPENPDRWIQVAEARIVLPKGVKSEHTPFILSDPSVKAKSLSFLVNTAMNVKTLLRHVFDLHSPPTRSLLKNLVPFCKDATQVAQLQELADAKYTSHVLNVRQPFGEILKVMTSVSIPLENFVQLAPVIQPRLYSISSAPVIHEKTVHLTISIVDTPSRDKSVQPENYLGFTSSFVAGLKK